MWLRRLELGITEPGANGFRFAEGLAMFKDRLHTVPEAAAGLKAMSAYYLKKLDAQIGQKQFVCGNRFTLADIALYCGLDFLAGVGQPRDPSLKSIAAWFERIGKRPSAEASIHPMAKAGGMRA
jgi:glutathione S-transferase